MSDCGKMADELFTVMVHAAKLPVQRHTAAFSRGELAILTCLVQHPEGMTSGELSNILNLGTGRVADALKVMERKHLIRRSRDNSDRRRVIVSISETGRALVRTKRAMAEEKLCVLLDELGEDDSAQLLRLMHRIADLNQRKQNSLPEGTEITHETA